MHRVFYKPRLPIDERVLVKLKSSLFSDTSRYFAHCSTQRTQLAGTINHPFTHFTSSVLISWLPPQKWSSLEFRPTFLSVAVFYIGSSPRELGGKLHKTSSFHVCTDIPPCTRQKIIIGSVSFSVSFKHICQTDRMENGSERTLKAPSIYVLFWAVEGTVCWSCGGPSYRLKSIAERSL